MVQEKRQWSDVAGRVIDSDTILVLSGGVVAERGTHEELIEMDGIYGSMWKAQNNGVGSESNLVDDV